MSHCNYIEFDSYKIVYDDEETVRKLKPNLCPLTGMFEGNVSATAPGASPDVDFVSRFFGPLCGIPEDPVTGSAHTALAPYWAQRLGKTNMEARQLSKRGGELHVALKGKRVLISGSTAFYMSGMVYVPQ